jgi:hypothetical protein
MIKEQLVELLTKSATANLGHVTRLCLEKIGNSSRCEITEGEYGLSAKHFHNVYALRMKNPNGIARATPGLPESVENFNKLDGQVKMISVDLDQDSLTVWLSEGLLVEGCMIHLGMKITQEDRKPKHLAPYKSERNTTPDQD